MASAIRQITRRVLQTGIIAIGAIWLQASAATAAQVGVFGNNFNLSVITNFYGALPSVTATNLGGTLGSGSLAGIDLLWAVQPDNAYTSGELGSMAGYLAGGGRIAFMGEHGFYLPNQNNNITAALSALGASMLIINDVQDSGFHDATVGNGQILSNPLTSGVDTYNYAAFATLSLSGTAQTLMVGIDHTKVMMGYQNIGAGSIFLISDQNVWDNIGSTGTNDNYRMMENLLTASTGAPPASGVPEPASMALLGFGLAGIAWSRRRR